MATPVIIDCPANTWTLVATGNNFQIHQKLTGPLYLWTYRDESDPAPTDKAEGVQMFIESISETFIYEADIDLYVWSDGKAGKVRRDVVLKAT